MTYSLLFSLFTLFIITSFSCYVQRLSQQPFNWQVSHCILAIVMNLSPHPLVL